MANVLLTGGRGFIGTNLAAELRQRGHSVWTCDLVHGEDDRHTKADVSVHRQVDALFRQQQYDYVYHLAAEYGRWNSEHHYENVWRTNVIGTKNVLKLQEQYGFRLIFFSSAEVYGDYDELMSEDVMERVPVQQTNDYAISKWAGELQCLNHTRMSGSEIVRVRPVGCYGPEEYYSPFRGVIPIFAYSALTQKKFTVYRGHRRIFDYVEDTCRTFANILDNFIAGEVYNVGGKEDWDVSIEELADMIVRIVGASPSLANYEGRDDFTTKTKIVDFSKARRDLHHEPKIGLQEGIERYVAWMRKVYDL